MNKFRKFHFYKGDKGLGRAPKNNNIKHIKYLLLEKVCLQNKLNI